MTIIMDISEETADMEVIETQCSIKGDCTEEFPPENTVEENKKIANKCIRY